MLKLFAVLLCLSVISQYADGAISIRKDEKPDNLKDREGCYVSFVRRVLRHGERDSDYSGRCVEYICPSGTTDESYQIATCPVYSAGCVTRPGNPESTYPSCCVQLEENQNGDGTCTAIA